ncbi:MAG: hypothetical protein KIS76_15255 [Pyrinomonadaceae bacterium]|nr:hypothetical protein [Pyrinomonadaceae bacterium]
MSGTGENQYKWTYGTRFIPDIINRAKWRNTLTYQVNSRLSVGIEYNPLAGKLSPLANFVAVTETEKRPALILGTSSDRIGTPSGQSFYATFSKNLKRETGLPIAPYVGLTYGTYENRVRPIGGLNIYLTKGFSTTILFDGVKVHPLLNYSNGRHQFGFMLAQGKKAGFSYSVSF